MKELKEKGLEEHSKQDLSSDQTIVGETSEIRSKVFTNVFENLTMASDVSRSAQARPRGLGGQTLCLKSRFQKFTQQCLTINKRFWGQSKDKR